jgi:hypothetical protein
MEWSAPGMISRQTMNDAETTEDEPRACQLELAGQTTAAITARFWQDSVSPEEFGEDMLVCKTFG